MPAWTPSRAARCVRNADGTFKKWSGGLTRAEDPRDSSRAGLYIHLSADFRKLKGRTPRPGDVHRCVDADGTYHEQAHWYVRTKNGWRKSPTGTRKPTAAQVQAQMMKSKPGGRKR